jgi:hypothetical protein
MNLWIGHVAFAVFLAGMLSVGTGYAVSPGVRLGSHPAAPDASLTGVASNPVGNFSSAVNRLVDLLAAAGGGILALVWARVAFSWFSNDITKKVQAKDRARDALIGTLVFTAAITGLVWGLAQWVITGV